MNWWLAYWLVWMAGFLVPEFWALWKTKGRGTFSVQVIWRWLKVTPGKTPVSAAFVRIPSYIFAAFLLWLLLHGEFGWFA